ncbi:MAG TPA: hypothetical protein VE913_17630, partial [Longimicrobium sp.]|nr:hypothetical protein [Longimicrobium sp.]
MRRSKAALLLPLVALAACATMGPGAPVGPGYGDAAENVRPLHARLFEGGGSIRVDLNRPAHVAIFEVVPGQGVALIYPRSSELSFFGEGSNPVIPSFASTRFWRYDGVRAGRVRGRFVNGYTPTGLAGGSGPRHLVLIASERPLEVERFQRGEGTLRRALGLASYTSMNQLRVVDDLLATVVPPQPDEAWSADVVTIWPRVTDVYERGAVLPVECRNGQFVYTPLELLNYACARVDRVTAPPAPPARGDSTGTPEGEVRKPEPRRPVPVAPREADGARGERITEMRRSLRERQARSAFGSTRRMRRTTPASAPGGTNDGGGSGSSVGKGGV